MRNGKMDLATLGGGLGALGLILLAASVGGAPLGGFIDLASILIVIGGTGFTLLMRTSAREFAEAFRALGRMTRPKLPDEAETVERLAALAGVARKKGLIALEGTDAPDRFVRKGIELVVDGADEEKLRTQLALEISMMKTRHKSVHDLWQACADYAPAMGMIGTLIGMVRMLGSIDDPAAIGPAMAVALLTTLYGALLANVLAAPIAAKLRRNSAREVRYREMVLDGLIAIAKAESPRAMQERLRAYVSEPSEAA